MTEASDPRLPFTVRETLDSVVAPAVRDSVLSSALRQANLAEVPAELESFLAFVEGPLRAAIIGTVGLELGESIVDELARLAAHAGAPSSSPHARWTGGGGKGPHNTDRIALHPSWAGSLQEPATAHAERPITGIQANGQRAERPVSSLTDPEARLAVARPPRGEVRTPIGRVTPPLREEHLVAPREGTRTLQSTRSTAPSPPSSNAYPRGTAEAIGVRGTRTPQQAVNRKLPYVLVATQEVRLVQQLSAWLDPRAAVMRVRGLLPLIQSLEDASGSRLVIILDCQRPSIRPAALAALAEELPADTQVVMWGATPEMEQQVVLVSEHARAWFVCSAHAEAKDVAERCVELIR